MRRVAFLGVLAAWTIGSAQAAVLEEFSAEDWSGFALADEATGRLASCAIYSNYQNGATLFFVRHVAGGWVLSLVHETWALIENNSYPVQYRVDRAPYAEGAGIALDVDQLGLAVPDDDPLIAAVRRGSLLNILFQGREFGFDLTNSGKALKAAVDCTERNRDKSLAESGEPQLLEPPSGATAALPPLFPDRVAEPAPPAGAAGPAAGENPPERQTFGPWVVAPTRDGSGHFLNCTAFGVHGTDQLILSYYPDDAWDLSLYRGAWNLQSDQTYTLSYNIDAPVGGPGSFDRPVEAVEMTRILLELERGDELIGRIEGGRTIHIRLAGPASATEDFSYGLAQAATALSATRECTRRHGHGT